MLIDDAFHSGAHAYTLRSIHHVGGLTLCVDIKRDFYLAQSHATVEVLTPQLTWTLVTSTSPNEWHKDVPSTAKNAESLQVVVDDLVSRACSILTQHMIPALNGFNIGDSDGDNTDTDVDNTDTDVDIKSGSEFITALNTVDHLSPDDVDITTGDTDAEALGARIRDTRERMGLTQKDLGQKANLERTVIGRIETGVRRVTALELADIAIALGVPMTSFFK